MRHIFIVNKISGKGSALQLSDKIEEVCKKKNLDYMMFITQYEGHAKEIASLFKKEDDACLYAVGGDGTILEVINGIQEDVPLGIIPAGSGNDFFRYYDDNKSRNMDFIIEKIIDAKEESVDIGETSVMKFINTTSFGLDAIINYQASKLIRKTIITKGPAYILSILRNLIVFKPVKAKLIVDGVDYSGKYLIISCMNGKYYGNGVKAAPDADVTDGYFDLVLFKNASRFRSYAVLGKYMKGKHINVKGMQIIRCKHIEIESDSNMYVQSDGENYVTKKTEINILPKSLKIKIPR